MSDYSIATVVEVCSFCGGDIAVGEQYYEDGFLDSEDGTCCMFCMAEILA